MIEPHTIVTPRGCVTIDDVSDLARLDPLPSGGYGAIINGLLYIVSDAELERLDIWFQQGRKQPEISRRTAKECARDDWRVW